MSTEVIITAKQLSPSVILAIRQGRRIEAIKILREETGLGLANAKVLVDQAHRTQGPRKPVPGAFNEVSGAAKLAKSVFLVMILIGFYYFYVNA